MISKPNYVYVFSVILILWLFYCYRWLYSVLLWSIKVVVVIFVVVVVVDDDVPVVVMIIVADHFPVSCGE